MYTLRFHFVGGGHYDEIITSPFDSKIKLINLAGSHMNQGSVKCERCVINTNNVTMIEVIEKQEV